MPLSNAPPFPARSDPRWIALTQAEQTPPVQLLALKLLLTRVEQDVKRDPSIATVNKAADELYEFFVKNALMVAGDAQTLFG
jgi:hypothetical protein